MYVFISVISFQDKFVLYICLISFLITDYSDGSSYVLMEPSNKSVAASQSTGQQQQQPQQQQSQQQIVGSPGADVTYIDMGPTGSSLPTVKESGSM